MKPITHAWLLLIALLAAPMALAQTDDSTKTEEFPLGNKPAAQVGQVYNVGKSGDWNVRCVKTEKPPEPCHIHQILADDAGNQVAEISFFHLPPGSQAAAGATATTPLGTLLQAGLLISIDGDEARQYPFNWCEAVGCVSRMGFTGLELEKMKKGKEAVMRVTSIMAPDKPVYLKISLTGFSEAFKKILLTE